MHSKSSLKQIDFIFARKKDFVSQLLWPSHLLLLWALNPRKKPKKEKIPASSDGKETRTQTLEIHLGESITVAVEDDKD